MQAVIPVIMCVNLSPAPQSAWLLGGGTATPTGLRISRDSQPDRTVTGSEFARCLRIGRRPALRDIDAARAARCLRERRGRDADAARQHGHERKRFKDAHQLSIHEFFPPRREWIDPTRLAHLEDEQEIPSSRPEAAEVEGSRLAARGAATDRRACAEAAWARRSEEGSGESPRAATREFR